MPRLRSTNRVPARPSTRKFACCWKCSKTNRNILPRKATCVSIRARKQLESCRRRVAPICHGDRSMSSRGDAHKTVCSGSFRVRCCYRNIRHSRPGFIFQQTCSTPCHSHTVRNVAPTQTSDLQTFPPNTYGVAHALSTYAVAMGTDFVLEAACSSICARDGERCIKSETTICHSGVNS